MSQHWKEKEKGRGIIVTEHFRNLCLNTLPPLCPSSNEKLSQYTGAVKNMDLK